jgi:hypothetical protein
MSNIIEEMRETADFLEDNLTYGPMYEGPDAAQKIRTWADRLAAATVLVAVPDGGKVQAFQMDGNDLLFITNGSLHIKDMDTILSLGPDRFYNHINDETLIQPVRLVPLAEATL